MTLIDKLVYARDGVTLSEANDLLWEHKLNALPVVKQRAAAEQLCKMLPDIMALIKTVRDV